MRRREPVCPYDHDGTSAAPVLIIRVVDRTVRRRFGGKDLDPQVRHGADVHCTVCHDESWVRVPAGWRPGDLTEPRVCACGETFG